jgi:hypothetical protein
MMLTIGVWWVRLDVLCGHGLPVAVGSTGVMVDGLLRLLRPLIMTCRGCLVVCVVCSASLVRSAVFSKQVVISSCFVDERSCSGEGPSGRVARVFARSPNHHADKHVDEGFGLESVSMRGRRWSRESACRNLRR